MKLGAANECVWTRLTPEINVKSYYITGWKLCQYFTRLLKALKLLQGMKEKIEELAFSDHFDILCHTLHPWNMDNPMRPKWWTSRIIADLTGASGVKLEHFLIISNILYQK